eukprot:TRINITY_DN4813_c0_g1_i1.p1 TRINITY_DN4813_c0_g1~~TRINITY_DN4813_c0_g1_i1.p1  ORF type:complete len:132 (-),score=28.88 TRINITY_DN4813_c0_g1_i1:31-426(-)
MDQKSELSSFFRDLIDRIPGVNTVLITDAEGVPLVSVNSDEKGKESSESTQSLPAVFSTATDQASKLKMGKNNSIVTFFGDEVVVQINQLPLVISFFCETDVNVGLLMGIGPEIKKLLEPLRVSIDDIEDD